MEGPTRKFQAAQLKAEQAAREVQRQINASYREGYLDGSVNERQLMTDDLRDMLNGFSQKCETRARTQETDLKTIPDLGSPEVADNGDEQEPGAFTKIAAKLAPGGDPNDADIQDVADQLEGAAKKSSRGRKTA